MHPFGCKDTDFFANNQIFRIKSYGKLYFEAKSKENSGYVSATSRRNTKKRYREAGTQTGQLTKKRSLRSLSGT